MGRYAFALASTLKIQPAQLGCLGGSAGRASAEYAGCHRFESRLRQPFFPLEKKRDVSFFCLASTTEIMKFSAHTYWVVGKLV